MMRIIAGAPVPSVTVRIIHTGPSQPDGARVESMTAYDRVWDRSLAVWIRVA